MIFFGYFFLNGKIISKFFSLIIILLLHTTILFGGDQLEDLDPCPIRSLRLGEKHVCSGKRCYYRRIYKNLLPFSPALSWNDIKSVTISLAEHNGSLNDQLLGDSINTDYIISCTYQMKRCCAPDFTSTMLQTIELCERENLSSSFIDERDLSTAACCAIDGEKMIAVASLSDKTLCLYKQESVVEFTLQQATKKQQVARIKNKLKAVVIVGISATLMLLGNRNRK